MGLGTLLAHFGEESISEGAAVPPLYQNSTFKFDRMSDLFESLVKHSLGPPYVYSRIGNPTVSNVEHRIAKLEGAEACRLVGFGLASLSTALISAVSHGSHIVAVNTGYGPVLTTLRELLERFGVTMTIVDGANTDELLDAIRPETSAVYLESPGSLIFQIQDVETITRVTRAKGITTVFDNTYNTPLHYQPLKHGIDLVCHSGTKYLGGHSDLTAGVICGSHERIRSISLNEVECFGNMLHPFQAWLLNRGLRTLKVRLKGHEAIANQVANWLETRPEVERVLHLGLESFPQRDLVQKMFSGTSGLFSFVPKEQSRAKVFAFCDELKLFGRGVSWGGFESLVIAAYVKTLPGYDEAMVIRLSCGLEEPEDLIGDLEAAMHHIS